MGTEEKPHRDHKKWVGTGWDYQMYHIFLFYQRGVLLLFLKMMKYIEIYNFFGEIPSPRDR